MNTDKNDCFLYFLHSWAMTRLYYPKWLATKYY